MVQSTDAVMESVGIVCTHNGERHMRLAINKTLPGKGNKKAQNNVTITSHRQSQIKVRM